MPSERRERGDRGELIAARYIQSLGWQIEATNVTYRCGELDIVARDGTSGQVVFIEVRARAAGSIVRPEQSVTYRKQRRLSRAARRYFQHACSPRDSCRFDVVGVCLGRMRVLRHIRGAFDISD